MITKNSETLADVVAESVRFVLDDFREHVAEIERMHTQGRIDINWRNLSIENQTVLAARDLLNLFLSFTPKKEAA